MTYELIKESDPMYFTCTSDESYDRHTYKLVDNVRNLSFLTVMSILDYTGLRM